MSGNVHARDSAFTALLAGAILAVLLVGFSRSFFLLPFFEGPPKWAAKEGIFYAHGAVFAAWFAVLAAQVVLIRVRNVRLHRRLGYAGAGVGALVVVAGTLAALRASNRPGGFIGVPVPPDQFLPVPLVGMLLFGVLLTLAVLWRREPARHKRMIFLASISLLGAPMARITSMLDPLTLPPLDIIAYAALVGLMLIWDGVTQRRVRPDTLIGGAAVVGLNAAAPLFGATAAWLAIAHPLMRLVPPP
jgi:uncharacterized membrane protein YozB (DUF420 family)